MTAILDRPVTVAAAAPEPPPREQRWVKPALIGLLVATAVLYLWNLSESGYANSFYAAAVQSGTKSWKAWFFGSLDPGNVITVDKPPASLWVMGLSGRIFGFNSWSLLVPQALEGVAAVGILYAAVKRWSGPAAGLVAGAALALTPAAALMFRFDNPDALLTMLLTLAAYFLVRGLEAGRSRWLMACATAIGFAFLAKMLQGFLVVPGFALVWLVAAPRNLRTRIGQLLSAGMVMIISGGWWVAIVDMWPAASRPYIGGSTNNTVLDLVLGYNGIGRISGGTGNGGGGMGGASGSSFGGATGWDRLFGSEMGYEISWLIPAAVIAGLGGLWLRGTAPRTDRTRAALLLWGTWFFTTAYIFSTMTGTIHPYYTVALAPAIAGLIAVGGAEMWRQRSESLTARVLLSAVIASAGIWSYELLGRNSGWQPWLRAIALLWTVGAAIGLLLPKSIVTRKAASALVILGIVGGLAGSGGYALATVGQAHTGSIPSVGPASSATGGFGGGGGGFGGGTTTTDTAIATLLKNAGTHWAAAAEGSQTSAELELSTGASVISIGGFNGGDPAPTLAQFETWVKEGKIHYYIAGGGMGGGGRGGSSSIASWVAANYTSSTVGSYTVYDLTSPTSTSSG